MAGGACQYETCQPNSCGPDFTCVDSETSSLICECNENICQHDAQCIEKDGQPSCQCQPPFAGDLCNECIPGFHGENCEFTDCTDVVCENGECVEPDNNNAFCDCKGTGYHGDKCQTDDCEKCDELENAGHLHFCLKDIYQPGNARCVCKSSVTDQDQLCFKQGVAC